MQNGTVVQDIVKDICPARVHNLNWHQSLDHLSWMAQIIIIGKLGWLPISNPWTINHGRQSLKVGNVQ
jgi:hypothetical protein